jgi:UDP-N-acetylmuramoyl-L-alanyl-D-glutamate--2,6-diaminopimelate ligase
MKLEKVLEGLEVTALRGDASSEIAGVTSDSRMVRQGWLFVAIRGFQQDGGRFVEPAIAQGAAAIVSELPGREGNAVFVQVSDARAALALVAANFYGRPADRLSIIGVTGTSGKTTTARMIESVVDATGQPAGLIGTIEYRAGDERLLADRTTPDAVVLQEWFAKMVAAGVQHAVMEVSSHALALHRTHGVHFAAAVFTNLSRDHFDFHPTFEDYFAAKKMLFDQIDRTRRVAVINGDDEWGRKLIAEMGKAAVVFGRSKGDVRPAAGFELSVRGLKGVVETPAGPVRIESSLVGLPNLYNWMAAIGAAIAVGFPIPTIEAGVRNLRSVRGRFEQVASTSGPTVIVDYAHKPDALEKLLHAVRELGGGGRIILVFGCGGDRDRGKRPLMGEIAGRLADVTVITSDNPRSESPAAIIREIEGGIRPEERAKVRSIEDRREAIRTAISEGREGDVVLIAGKGHENYQVVGDQILHFDDREEAELVLKKRTEKMSEKSA